jgi:hypothetical protein
MFVGAVRGCEVHVRPQACEEGNMLTRTCHKTLCNASLVLCNALTTECDSVRRCYNEVVAGVRTTPHLQHLPTRSHVHVGCNNLE